MHDQIEIIPSFDIDENKWNQCVVQSDSPLLYANALYLNYCCDNWSGIVVNDYDAVMPVPWRKKFGIRYCYTVPFIQQLGYFTRGKDLSGTLLATLKTFCRYGDYTFNYANQITGTAHCNYVLDLSVGHDAIIAGYKSDAKRSIRMAAHHSLLYIPGAADEAISFYKRLYSDRIPHVQENEYRRFAKLCIELEKLGSVIVRKAVKENGEVLSISLILNDGKRLYNITNSTTESGRTMFANYYLYDHIFAEFAGNDFLFDFEGSDLEGVALFYRKFGAILQSYTSIHINTFPFPLSMLKP